MPEDELCQIKANLSDEYEILPSLEGRAIRVKLDIGFRDSFGLQEVQKGVNHLLKGKLSREVNEECVKCSHVNFDIQHSFDRVALTGRASCTSPCRMMTKSNPTALDGMMNGDWDPNGKFDTTSAVPLSDKIKENIAKQHRELERAALLGVETPSWFDSSRFDQISTMLSVKPAPEVEGEFIVTDEDLYHEESGQFA